MFSQSTTQEYYEYFFKYIRRLVHEKVGRTLQVVAIFADYEDALRNALCASFPGTKVFGDTFHFVQANTR